MLPGIFANEAVPATAVGLIPGGRDGRFIGSRRLHHIRSHCHRCSVDLVTGMQVRSHRHDCSDALLVHAHPRFRSVVGMLSRRMRRRSTRITTAKTRSTTTRARTTTTTAKTSESAFLGVFCSGTSGAKTPRAMIRATAPRARSRSAPPPRARSQRARSRAKVVWQCLEGQVLEQRLLGQGQAEDHHKVHHRSYCLLLPRFNNTIGIFTSRGMTHMLQSHH
jgi:hypothetical protein